MKKRKSAFLRALEARREAARQTEETGETGEATGEPDAETPLTRFLLPKRRRPYWK